MHLLDAVADVQADRRAGRFNPLVSTGTPALVARATAERLRAQVTEALARVDLAGRALVDVLLGRELRGAVHRAFPVEENCSARIPRQRSGSSLPWRR